MVPSPLLNVLLQTTSDRFVSTVKYQDNMLKLPFVSIFVSNLSKTGILTIAIPERGTTKIQKH